MAPAACKTESSPPIYLDANYQVRCLDCEPRTGDEPERDIALLDGEDDFTITCDVKRISGKRSMTLVVSHTAERESSRYGFRITRANIDEGDQPDECKIRVTEGANVYEGACTGGEPSTGQPCTVEFDRKAEIVEGRLYCDKIPNQANLASFKYLLDPGSNDDPMKFAVHNCTGL